ncbi:MAG: hypothetical protein ACOCP3_02285, partial [Halodesulfurarchaeum sp.]
MSQEQSRTLEDRVNALEAELDEKIQDVRERVIQVKREADGKAPADHEHESLESLISALESDYNSLERH